MPPVGGMFPLGSATARHILRISEDHDWKVDCQVIAVNLADAVYKKGKGINVYIAIMQL